MAGKGKSEVGKGKPPKEHQFKPGNRANPGGRPKGKSLTSLLRDHLAKNDWETGSKLIQAMILQAAKGNGAAMKVIFDRVEGPVVNELKHSFDLTKLSEEELDIIERILGKASPD